MGGRGNEEVVSFGRGLTLKLAKHVKVMGRCGFWWDGRGNEVVSFGRGLTLKLATPFLIMDEVVVSFRRGLTQKLVPPFLIMNGHGFWWDGQWGGLICGRGLTLKLATPFFDHNWWGLKNWGRRHDDEDSRSGSITLRKGRREIVLLILNN